MATKVQLAASFGICLMVFAGCKTSENGSAVKDDEAVGGAPAAPAGQPDFCVSQATGRADLEHLTKEEWAQIFTQGLASAALIPSADHPGIATPGKGFPKIVSSFLLNSTANRIWDGKTMFTDEQGNTKLINRFFEHNEQPLLPLFTASVVIDPASRWRANDGKPVILLDYTQTKLADPSAGLGKIDDYVVPVISAVRDEIRLVCQTTTDGVRRRLYLGPTFLLPSEFKTTLGKKLAKKFEVDPILWFALEYEEPAT